MEGAGSAASAHAAAVRRASPSAARAVVDRALASNAGAITRLGDTGLGLERLMGRSSKYPRELRERGVRMVDAVRPGHPSEYTAMAAVAGTLGIGFLETIRTWIRRNQVGAGERFRVTTDANV